MVVLFFLAMSSCDNEAWDDHYENVPTQRNQKVVDWLSNSQDYSKFYALLESTGVIEELKKSHASTVWAVKNDQIGDFSKLSPSAKERLARNHVNIGNTYVNRLDDEVIRTLNGKLLRLARKEGKITVGDQVFLKTEGTFLDGLLHQLDGLLLPKLNILEYFKVNAPKFTKVNKLLEEGKYKVVDYEKSIAKGVNEQGETVYDTVWMEKNSYLEKIGDFSDEDKMRSLFLPTDEMIEKSFSVNFYEIFDQGHKISKAKVLEIKGLMENAILANWLLKDNYESIEMLPDNIEGAEGRMFATDMIKEKNSVVNLSNGVAYAADYLKTDIRDLIVSALKVEVKQVGDWYNENRVRSSSDELILSRSDKGLHVVAANKEPGTGIGAYIEIDLPYELTPNITYKLESRDLVKATCTKVKVEIGDLEYIFEGAESGNIWGDYAKEGIIVTQSGANKMRITMLKANPKNENGVELYPKFLRFIPQF